MDDPFEQFRDELIWALLHLAAGAHSKNSEDQHQIARDFRDAINRGGMPFHPDDACTAQLGKAVKQDPKRWRDRNT